MDWQISELPAIGDSLPWWLWPNLWGIDAVLVAVVWQRYLAAAFHAEMPVFASAALGLIVWGIYLSDRWLDTRTADPAAWRDRHRYAARHPRLFAGLACAAFGAGLASALELPLGFLETGGLLAGVVLLYFASVHCFGLQRRTGIKEFAVGLLFASGVSVPLFAGRVEAIGAWMPACAAFALLCAGNCLLIDDWESSVFHADRPIIRYGGVASIILLSLFAPLKVSGTLLASTFGLILLNRMASRISSRALRVLADVALLSPLLAGLAW